MITEALLPPPALTPACSGTGLSTPLEEVCCKWIGVDELEKESESEKGDFSTFGLTLGSSFLFTFVREAAKKKNHTSDEYLLEKEHKKDCFLLTAWDQYDSRISLMP